MKKLILCIGLLATLRVQAVTTGVVPANGVFRLTFGAERASEGFAVSASAVYDASHEYANTPGSTFTYGFLGTMADSYKKDVPWSMD